MYEDVTLNYGSGRYFMYLRKSRKDLEAEERGEGETLERHFNILKDLAKRMRLNVVKVYAEIVSGESIDARPYMQELLRDVELGDCDGVLVVEVERLARGDTSDQGRVAKTFKFSSTLIITPSKTYDPNNEDDEEYFEFGLFMSRREYKTTRRRLMSGRAASISEGKYVSPLPPYGYERVKLKREKGWSLRIVPEQAQVVRMIFDWYINGLNGEPVGYGKIADELNRLCIPSYTGSTWSAYSAQGILQNPVYAGYIKDGRRKDHKQLVDGKVVVTRPVNHDYKLFKGRHEPIITQEQWDVVSKRFRSRYADSSNKNRPIQNPLTGIIYCSCCHKVMQRRPYQDGTPDSLICLTKGCPTVSSFIYLVEQRVLDTLEAWLSEYQLPEVEPDNSEKLSLLEAAISSCQTELDETAAQIERQYDFLERGIYSEEMFFQRNAVMKNRKAELEEKLAFLRLELQEESGRDEAMKNLIPVLQTIHEAYFQIESPAARNALLKEVIDHTIYTKTQGGRWGKPDSFTLEIFPKIK